MQVGQSGTPQFPLGDGTPRSKPTGDQTITPQVAASSDAQGTIDQSSAQGLLAHVTDPVSPAVISKRGLTLADASDSIKKAQQSMNDAAQWV